MKTQDTFSEENKIQFFQEHGELPPDYLREYDGAAEHYARQGKLPEAMGSPGAIDYIEADPEAFDQRVNDFRYGLANETPRVSLSAIIYSNTLTQTQQGKVWDEKAETDNDLEQESIQAEIEDERL